MTHLSEQESNLMSKSCLTYLKACDLSYMQESKTVIQAFQTTIHTGLNLNCGPCLDFKPLIIGRTIHSGALQNSFNLPLLQAILNLIMKKVSHFKWLPFPFEGKKESNHARSVTRPNKDGFLLLKQKYKKEQTGKASKKVGCLRK